MPTVMLDTPWFRASVAPACASSSWSIAEPSKLSFCSIGLPRADSVALRALPRRGRQAADTRNSATRAVSVGAGSPAPAVEGLEETSKRPPSAMVTDIGERPRGDAEVAVPLGCERRGCTSVAERRGRSSGLCRPGRAKAPSASSRGAEREALAAPLLPRPARRRPSTTGTP